MNYVSAQHGSMYSGVLQVIEIAGRRVAVDEDEVRVIAGADGSDSVPSEDLRSACCPHGERFLATDDLVWTVVSQIGAGNLVRLRKCNLFPGILRSPVRPAGDVEACVE